MSNDPFLGQLRLKAHQQDSFLDRFHIDLPLLGGLMMLSAIAMVVLYSASGQDPSVLIRQFARLVLAVTVMVGVAHVHPRHLHFAGPFLYLL